ncbi:MAG: LuxR family transcriptional regulator [Flavobacteriaceae bacterium]|nr:LuxR family transcriptional regulator [Flavobacteriaceae bacterium]
MHLDAQTLPPIQIFRPENYQGDNQNWMISESPDKYIYVANNDGLLEYNGAKWTLYPSPNNTIIRAVKVIDGVIYTGCYMDFGFWKRNPKGILEYHSLVKETGSKMLDDENVWNIEPYEDWVLFQTYSRIYIYNTKKGDFKIIDSDKTVIKIFNINNNIYYSVAGHGIYQIKEGKPVSFVEDKLLKNYQVVNIFPYEEDGLLIETRNSGFYIYKDEMLSKWEIPADDLLNKVSVFCSIRLKDASFVIGTISDGIIHLTNDGDVDFQINQENGLSNNTVLSLFEDNDKNIWVGLDNGINCINIDSPFRVFNDNDGILGTVYTSKVYDGYLYLGTNQGLFYKKLTDINNSFRLIKGTSGQVYDLCVYNNEDLICGHHLGTFLIKEDKAFQINNILGAWTFRKLPKSNELLLQGNYSGLYVLEKKNGNWKLRNKIEGFSSSARYFEIDNDNNVWVSHEYKGVFKLHLNVDYTKVISVSLDPDLPIGENSSLSKYKTNILYTFKEGVFKYDTIQRKFERDSSLSKLIDKNDYLSGKLVVDDEQRIWSFSKDKINYATVNNITNSIKINQIQIPVYLRGVISGYENITHLDKNIYLLGTANGYLTIDLSKINFDKDFDIKLNAVSLKNLKADAVNFNLNETAIFDNGPNTITIDFSVPHYDKYQGIKYQYKLEGHSNEWTDWTDKGEARFENLSFGEYTFKARAKMENKISNNVLTFKFKIKRPWYLSNPMLLAYFILIMLVFYIVHRINKYYYNKELKNKQLESEKLIMHIKNEQLNQDIENKNRELTLSKMSIIKKNELLNNIKKELRNEDEEKNVGSVIKLIDKNLNNTKDWEVFVKAFNNTDKGFLDKMKTLHPDLTPNDLRICVYLRMNLTSKEIAPLLNISVKSVETKRYRLRKRMNLPHEESLVNYILSL